MTSFWEGFINGAVLVLVALWVISMIFAHFHLKALEKSLESSWKKEL